ncbi:MAG: hypothetical protein KDL10_02140, partial [Kiritimatiellae bacterium]|nr:hypothetical protein [Kiritimatiellia bacterium]
MLDHFAFLVAHAVHQFGNAFGLEEAHEVIFQGHVELAATGVALPAGTAAQLAVDAARVVALGTYNGQAPRFFNCIVDLDVGTPAGHVGSDGDFAGSAGFGDDLRFALVLFGVE